LLILFTSTQLKLTIMSHTHNIDIDTVGTLLRPYALLLSSIDTKLTIDTY